MGEEQNMKIHNDWDKDRYVNTSITGSTSAVPLVPYLAPKLVIGSDMGAAIHYYRCEYCGCKIVGEEHTHCVACGAPL